MNYSKTYESRSEVDHIRYLRNKEKHLSMCKTWIENNKERWREYNKRYQHRNTYKEKSKQYMEKRKEKTHNISKNEWVNCKLYFGNSCAYCGKTEEENKIETKKGLHRDHVIHNGRNDLKNCIPACRSCNSEKHEKTLNQWYNKENRKFSKEKYYLIYLWLRCDCKKFIEKKRKYKRKTK